MLVAYFDIVCSHKESFIVFLLTLLLVFATYFKYIVSYGKITCCCVRDSFQRFYLIDEKAFSDAALFCSYARQSVLKIGVVQEYFFGLLQCAYTRAGMVKAVDNPQVGEVM